LPSPGISSPCSPSRIDAKSESQPGFVGQVPGVCLGDLLFHWVLLEPIIKGRILLFPESALPPRRSRYDAHFLYISFAVASLVGLDPLTFHDAPSVETLGNGFATTSPSIRYVDMASLKWTMIESGLARSDSFSMTFDGGDLGEVGYSIGEIEWVCPSYTVSQQIKTMSICAALTKAGLEITGKGELGELDAAKNRRHSGNPNFPKLQSNPIRTFALEATVPWALLAAKGIKIAHRARCF